MKLYSGPLSLFSAKVRMALAEKGIAYERIEVPFSRARGYQPKHPDVVRLNPKAQVPVLVDGDVTVYDSTIIFEYLEETHPEPALYPRDPRSRARARQLEAFADELLFPSVWVLIQQLFYRKENTDESAIAAARADIGSHFATLDAELGDKEYLCESFTVADIACFVTASFAVQLGTVPDSSCTKLIPWLGRVSSRPAIATEMAEMMAAAASAS